ncbi:hypothetical protein NCS57_00700700 [Fusarium keratoplasticum]|uniref:Uncharacterized protein n=1 Tax=Fusarium keratoplasticum TaxID=1328300 RepID=A0ACC0QWI2_9HYPO|nr:hypothetical protein NCS57_00700700 [Fusarium keratoplasticum]KAI8668875.1 hypothetical protein NCS57_00700700 [Fusarium keratoplasticum]
MCYANLGTLVCQACGRRVGEQPVGTTPCLAGCGKYVSRVTGAVVRGECGGAAWGGGADGLLESTREEMSLATHSEVAIIANSTS